MVNIAIIIWVCCLVGGIVCIYITFRDADDIIDYVYSSCIFVLIICSVFVGKMFYDAGYNYDIIDNKTETVFIEELPNQETTYYALTENSNEKNFTYFDGEVQQTLSGDYKMKVYYEEGLKTPYIKASYSMTQSDKENPDKSLDELFINFLEVNLSK